MESGTIGRCPLSCVCQMLDRAALPSWPRHAHRYVSMARYTHSSFSTVIGKSPAPYVGSMVYRGLLYSFCSTLFQLRKRRAARLMYCGGARRIIWFASLFPIGIARHRRRLSAQCRSLSTLTRDENTPAVPMSSRMPNPKLRPSSAALPQTDHG